MCNRKTVLVITVLMLALQSAALTGCGQEKQEEMSRLSQRLATVEETSRVLREKEADQQRVGVRREGEA